MRKKTSSSSSSSASAQRVIIALIALVSLSSFFLVLLEEESSEPSSESAGRLVDFYKSINTSTANDKHKHKHKHKTIININNIKKNKDSSSLSVITNNITNTNTNTNTTGGNLQFHFDPELYEKQLSESMTPLTNPNVTTVAYLQGLYGGFRNQYMNFAGIIHMIVDQNNKTPPPHHNSHSQIIVQSIKWKDLFGTNQKIRHDYFFDVVHWNSYYPHLPRLVDYNTAPNPEMFQDIKFYGDAKSPKKQWNVYEWNATRPYAIGRTGMQAVNQYKQYTRRVVEGQHNRSQWDVLMLQGAFRPHPRIQLVIDSFLDSLRDNVYETNHENNHETNHEYDRQKPPPLSYMALHARIEPDMQKHMICKDLKVTNISDIIQSLYKEFEEPPVSKVLIILNRPILEKEVADVKGRNNNSNNNNSNNNHDALAEYNLRVLNEIVQSGLWGGRVQVVEAGTGLAKQSSSYPIATENWSLVGSIIDFFLAVQASIFVGTAVSSFSVDIEITRFHRDQMENYHYLPHGLELSTVTGPPRFEC